MRIEQQGSGHSILGPVAIILVGSIFLLQQLVPELHFGKLWPLLMIGLGIAMLFEPGRRRWNG